MRIIQNSRSVLRAALACLGAAFLLVACQTPTENPPVTLRTVTVQVQDANGRSMEAVPVEMRDLTAEDIPLIDTEITDAAGNARFGVDIPTTGKPFRFIVGTDATGRVFVDANLLCRDTVIVAMLATELLPCGESVSRLLRIEDVCAPLRTGERFSDSTQYTFTNTCDEALTFSLTGPATEEVRLVLLDINGKVIVDRPFTIPPRGQFTVRAIGTPADSGLRRVGFVFTGTGPNNASATLNLDVEIDARNCNTCECPEEEIIVNFGQVEAVTGESRSERTVRFPTNLCRFLREDNIIKKPTREDRFGVPPIEGEVVEPGEYYTRLLFFKPGKGDFSLVEDTILVEHWIPDEGKACTTRVILRGQGCGPECALVTTEFTPVNNVPEHWDYRLDRIRVYESGSGQICVRHVGECGELVVRQSAPDSAGFAISPSEVSIPPGGRGCFTVTFRATDEVIWPDGHGQPAKVDHVLPVDIFDCGATKRVNVLVRVDTLPAQFSRCIYQWDQNGMYGYNFTPVEGKGEDRYDPDQLTQQISDFVVLAVTTGSSADVRLKGRWKFVKSGVSEAQFNFDDMSKGLNGWSVAEYRSITTGAFQNPGVATLAFRSVYSLEIVRGGELFYACIRVREVSVDPDGKFKICLDVLFPMIKE